MNERNEAELQKIPKRVLNSLLISVSAGVVPRIGAPYIAIGRKDEISALLSDLEQAVANYVRIYKMINGLV